ncbi:MAG: hypothetical protein AB8B93_10365 [Pseudomonadales bacterium]
MRYATALLTLVLSMPALAAQNIPQIPAFLPMAHTIPAGAKAPIDGEWMISTIGKRIRIEGGRAYALDPWVHLFVLQIKPMMVVISDIASTDGRNYAGKDLPLMGAWGASLNASGTLDVTVQTMVGPARYQMMPVRIDDQDAYDRAKSGEAIRQGDPDDEPEQDEESARDDEPEDEWEEEPGADDWEDWD